MELYTLDRSFKRQDPVDSFEAAIWSERYYGDGDFELSVPAEPTFMTLLPKGQLMECVGSDEPMILEHREIKDGIMKTTGITLTKWLNNRIIRTTADHAIKEWVMPAYTPGRALKEIVQAMVVAGSPYLSGATPIGIPAAQTALFAIPGLQIGAFDDTGAAVAITVPFGPVYDPLNQIATTYEVGMKIIVAAVDPALILQFVTYRGKDRTSVQSVNPVVQFSRDMDSFTGISDLESITEHRNYIYMFAPSAGPALATTAGHAETIVPPAAGLDLRVFQGFADDIPTSGLDAAGLLTLLNQKALAEAINHKQVALVDGEIVQVEGAKYGEHFFLGDVVEVVGNTGVLQKARITEYIRSKDIAGERAYPTLTMID